MAKKLKKIRPVKIRNVPKTTSHRQPKKDEYDYSHTSAPNVTLNETGEIKNPPRFIELTNKIVGHFGRENILLSFTPFDKRRNPTENSSMFADDNLDNMFPWLAIQMTKMLSGRVDGISIILRVFDETTKVEVEGPNGLMEIPSKDIYMFFCERHKIQTVTAADALAAHSKDMRGKTVPPEKGGRYRSSAELLRTLHMQDAGVPLGAEL